MAINDMANLTEITEASSLTDNNFIAVSDSTDAKGWKKIKANALGGGGGDSSNVVVLEFELVDYLPKSKNTCGEIKDIVESGKAILGLMNVAPGIVSQLSVAFTNFGSTSTSESTMVVFGWDDENKQVTSMELTAATYNNVFELSM